MHLRDCPNSCETVEVTVTGKCHTSDSYVGVVNIYETAEHHVTVY